jgi:predicted SnoaL-like aldol condensation-catalyzing enzyme
MKIMAMKSSWSLLSVILLACAVVPVGAADQQGERNKQVLRQFLDEMRVAGFVHRDANEIRAVVERYTVQGYVQHSKRIPPGQEGLIKNYAAITSKLPEGKAPPDPGDLYFVADGDRVVWISKKPDPKQGGDGSAGLMFQMVLFKDGKIAEHWDSLD